MIDKVGAIIIRDRKMLVARNKGREMYFIPGGQRGGNETDEETLAREIKEELYAEIKNAKFYKEYRIRNQDLTDRLLLRTYFVDIAGEPKPSSEIEEIAWVDRINYNKYNLGTALKSIIPELIQDDYL